MSYRLIESAWTLAILAVLVAVMYALTGCAATPVKPIVDIQRPLLPTIPAEHLKCLDPNTRVSLSTRDVRLHQYAEELEVIISKIAEVP